MAGNNATKIPVIKGKVFKIRPKDNDSMFPFNSVLAETKPPVIPVGFHPQLKPPLQILYEQSYKGHNQQNPSSFKAILQKKENQRNNDDNDAETHLSSPTHSSTPSNLKTFAYTLDFSRPTCLDTGKILKSELN